MVTAGPRIIEELNQALHAVLGADERVYLLGEDVADPYGGAFRATKGLSTAYPDRVLSTPISESGMVGVAGGLALCGNTVIVEMMFGDFIALGFDQILNFATKSVSMYGRHTPMRLVVRCPVGGGRGYGPTHSQSLQKHFLGIPHLALYELSPFHEPQAILDTLMSRDEPAILFEDKTLYTRRRYSHGRLSDRFRFDHLDEDRNWVRVWGPGTNGEPIVLIATGGTALFAVAAAERLIDEDGFDVTVLVPARLYPVAVGPVLPLIVGAAGTWVVEESTAGGTWGAEVAAQLHAAAVEPLRQPVRLIHSADRVIPAAPHLEQTVLVQPSTIVTQVRQGRRARATADPSAEARAVAVAVAVEPADNGGSASGAAVLVPTLNNNDTTYVVDEWLVADGTAVGRDDPIVVLETSKATEEIVTELAGVLRIVVPALAECAPGEILAYVEPAGRTGAVSTAAAVATQAPASATQAPASAVPAASVALSPAQRQVAEVVSASHREIPPAFVAVRADVDATLELMRCRSSDDGEVGLAELVIKALSECRADFPMLFATGFAADRYSLVDGTHVALTVDVGTGVFLPVIRDVDRLELEEIADRLVELRMRTLRGTLRETDLAGGNLALSINPEPDILLVQPIIPPGLAGVVSVTGIGTELALSADGQLHNRRTVGLGVAYDHRLVNGRGANGFLARLKQLVEEPAWATAGSR